MLTALDAARLRGGILLHGPRGIGKATLAFDFARAVFARTGDESPDHIAAQVAAGAYPNLRVLRKAVRDTGKGFYTAIRVEEVRGLIGDSRMTRGRAGFRIVIVDSIDDCNPSSANALLKILEEPPAGQTLFLLVSHRPGGTVANDQVALPAGGAASAQPDARCARRCWASEPVSITAVELAARPAAGAPSKALAIGRQCQGFDRAAGLAQGA